MQTISLSSTPLAMLWVGRVVSGLVTLFLLFDGGIKLVPLDIVIETSRQMGIPEHLARTLGVLTLAGTLLYVFPRTAVLGAILLTGYFGGAIYAHVRIDSPLFSHTLFGVYLGVLMWLGLWLRDARLRALLPLVRS
ncbi:MAG: DoxX family protein [Pseudolabrys sp.]